MSSTHTFIYTRTYTAVFVADNMRNLLRDLIAGSGLDQTKLVDDWRVIGEAVKTWLGTGDLLEITIEFFMPGSNSACLRWDFPISYDGSGVEDDMWVAKDFIRRTIEKAGKPPADAKYSVLLLPKPGRPDVAGMSSTSFRSTEGLVSRTSGTAIATPDIMATMKYWRAA